MQSQRIHPFLSYDELKASLEELASRAPGVVRLVAVGTTASGRTIHGVEVGDASVGVPLDQRPAFLVSGNVHAVEYAGSYVALQLLRALVEGHAHDEFIQNLLREHVLYIIPRVAVDGAEFTLNTYHRVRSVPPRRRQPNAMVAQDIDGDGRILSMRVEDPNGPLKCSARDPRLLVPKEPGDTEGPFYRLLVEGLIHDWDGTAYQNVLPDVDFNRNFPASWSLLGHGVTSGLFPLQEPETRALVEFVVAHPNLVGAVDLHTGNPTVFYPFSAIKGQAAFEDDAQCIAAIGSETERITGFPLLSGYAEVSRGEHSRLPGSFKDWLYEHRGIPAFVIELGLFYNSLGIDTAHLKEPVSHREEATGLALLAWHDANRHSELFYEWRAFDHPQIGPVEIGGWNYILWSNPPPHELDAIGRRCIDAVFNQLRWSPKVQLKGEIEPLGSGYFKVSVDVTNSGRVPTYGTRQALASIPDTQLQLQIEAPHPIEFVVGERMSSLGHLQPLQQRRVEWVIRSTQEGPVHLCVSSGRGIYASLELPLTRG